MTTKKTELADEAVASTESAESKPAVKATRPARGGKAPTARERPLKAAMRQRPATPDGEAERNARADTKQAKLIGMLHTKHGATVDEIASAFGWQAHTVRGALYGALKKKLALDISSEKVEGRGRVYRIGS